LQQAFRKVGTMPDDRAATQAAGFEASFATVSDEFAITSSRAATSDRRYLKPIAVDSEALLQQQIEVIEQSVARVRAENPAVRFGSVYRLAKRSLDLLLSVPALIVLAPFFLLVGILIRIDSSGPAFFTQHRIGENGRPFRMYKFRTMTNGAGVLRGTDHKRRADNRVTRVGRFLRMTSIDELPQLLNVALGQMSMVGPRPEIPTIIVDRYETWQYKRLLVPQGITGWWQVTGRGKKLLWKHTEDDLYYIAHASFWFDLKLLAMTVRAVISRNGAF
jgi:lipopolysaccharide/colanic/teichoic acid biosynthesis glycosyltransferase